MALRVIRHLGARSVNADSAKVLAVIGFGAAEDINGLRMDGYAATRADSYADQPSECNWYAIAAPWHVILTGGGSLTTTGGEDSADIPDSAGEWDTLFKKLLLDASSDGNDYYGGDTDGPSGGSAHPDTIDSVAERDTSASSGGDQVEGLGPLSVRRVFSREVICRPLLAEGENKVRFYDEFRETMPAQTGYMAGGALMVGMMRYEHAAQTTFGWSVVPENYVSALIGGDMTRIQRALIQQTNEAADDLRTVLFGGDNYIEGDTLKGDPMKAYVKLWSSVSTPYKLI